MSFGISVISELFFFKSSCVILQVTGVSDDIIISGEDQKTATKDHDVNQHTLLELCRTHGMKLRLEKAEMLKKSWDERKPVKLRGVSRDATIRER